MLTTAPPVYPVPPAWSAEAKVDAAAYAAGYRRSLDDAEAYWLEQARRLDWLREPTCLVATHHWDMVKSAIAD
ncbi:acetyl-coenzyme A synthetase N-terminal domain-containing protein, partial [Sphingobium fuliginis]